MSEMKPIPVLARPTVKFTIPEAARQFATDPTEVTLRPLSVREELNANKAARLHDAPDAALTYELIRYGTAAVNGKPVDWSTEDPQWVEATSPKCRELIMKGFLRVNRMGESKEDKAAEASFFESMVVTTA